MYTNACTICMYSVNKVVTTLSQLCYNLVTTLATDNCKYAICIMHVHIMCMMVALILNMNLLCRVKEYGQSADLSYCDRNT